MDFWTMMFLLNPGHAVIVDGEKSRAMEEALNKRQGKVQVIEAPKREAPSDDTTYTDPVVQRI